jgi:hypothetical protein
MTASGFTTISSTNHTPLVKLDAATAAHFERHAAEVFAEFHDGLRTVVVLMPWQEPPDRYQRIDGAVRSFVCSPAVFDELLAIDPECPDEELCFSLLEAMMNGNIAVDRVLVRQLPYPEHAVQRKVDPIPASLIMAHRGRLGYLRTSLDFLSKANGLDLRIRVGLDGEAPNGYDALAERFPATEFYRLLPALGPYVIRQELAMRSSEPLLAFHDSDDISCADRFSALRAEMLRTTCELIGCHELRVDEITREVLPIRFPLDATEGLRRCYGHALLHPTSMVTREGFLAAGGFSTNFAISCDMQFLLRCYFKLRIRNADGFFYIRRRHPAALTVAPDTNMDAPIRVYLNKCWEKNFEAVKHGQIPLEQSALRQMTTNAKYQLSPLQELVKGSPERPGWSLDEVRATAAIRREIDECFIPRRRKPRGKSIRILLSEADVWREGMQEVQRAILVRQLFNALRLDEHRVFRWRLEHKLVQALILDAYLPGAAPVTRGLARLARTCATSRPGSNAALRGTLEQLFPDGYHLKRALSDSSGDEDLANEAAERAMQAIEEGLMPDGIPSIAEEEWIVQEKIPIDLEFRVHSIQDRVIEDLTFRRYARGDIPSERDAPNRYMQSILDRLPAGIVSGTLCGWDIARTPEGSFRIIEVNFAGFHPVYRPGFQVSGFFVNSDWGAKSTAQLMRFVERTDGVRIDAIADVDTDSKERAYYDHVNRWKQLLAQEEARWGAAPWQSASKGASPYPSKGTRASTPRYGKGGG